MKKQLFFLIAFLAMALQSSAYNERNLLQSQIDKAQLKQVLITNQKWVPYPAYADRAAWDAFTGDWKAEYIKRGESRLTYDWKVITASEFLEFERSGNRKIMENPYFDNRSAFSDLLMAELAEGQGRFIDKIIDGVFYYCEMTTWALSAHTNAQASHRSLPTLGDDVFDLFAGDMGTLLSWTYYYLKPQFDKVDPQISVRLRYELQHRILDTFNKGGWGWMPDKFIEGKTSINNWTPWCDFNALATILLLENDPEKMTDLVYKSMKVMDLFINDTNLDGCCDEGPGYWNAAGAKMYDYLQLLYQATGGKVNVFSDKEVKNMGEYIAQAYAGKGWVVNFSDASARGGGDPALIYRFGKAVNSDVLMSQANYLKKLNGERIAAGNDITRILEAMRCRSEFAQYTKDRVLDPYTWYPQTQVCFIRDGKGLMLAAKGGNNDESHNHNDVGTFIFYKNGQPLFIDAGVGVYTRQTFSSERYSIWTMQSNYHNLPMINGVAEKNGANYKAASAVMKGNKTFMVDIATAYPAEAAVKSWLRSYTLANGMLKISDKFSLTEAKAANQVNFLVWGTVNAQTPGEVSIDVKGEKMTLCYDKNAFDCQLETITVNDANLKPVWGSTIYRIALKAKKLQQNGTYNFTIK